MVELEVDVVQMAMRLLAMGDLIVLGRDVALLIEILGAHLSDVHIDQVGIVAVDFDHLVLIVAINVDVVRRADMVVWQDNLRMSVLISRGIHVPDLQILVLFVFVDAEVEVLLRDDLIVGALGKILRVDIVLELNKTDLLVHNSVDSLADGLQVAGTGLLTQL